MHARDEVLMTTVDVSVGEAPAPARAEAPAPARVEEPAQRRASLSGIELTPRVSSSEVMSTMTGTKSAREASLSGFKEERGHEWHRLRMEKYYSHNPIVQSFMTFLIALSCLSYVHETYIGDQDSGTRSRSSVIDHITSSIFVVDYCLTLVSTAWPLDYALSFIGLCDLMGVLPWIVEVFLLIVNEERAKKMSHATFTKLLRAYKMLKVLRILKMKKVISSFSEASTSDEQQEDEWHHRVRSLVFSIAIVMFVSTGSIYALEASQPRSFSNNCYDDDDDSCQLEWHDAFYFVIVTLTTVGYGDILPMTWQARMLQSLLMLIGGAILANEISMLMDACAQISPYAGSFEDWHVWTRLGMGKPAPHIVICSDRLNELTVFHLLEEIVHEDHHVSQGRHRTPFVRERIVLLAPGAPSFGLQQVIGRFKRHTDVVYLQGSAKNPGDLRRARVEHARAVFVLTPTGLAHGARTNLKASAESIVLTASMVWLYIHRSTLAYLRGCVQSAALPLSEEEARAMVGLYTTDLSHLPSDVAATLQSRNSRKKLARSPSSLHREIAEVDKAQATLRKFWEHEATLPDPHQRLYVQTYTREARATLLDMRLKNVVSAHELKASVLALGTVHPGAVALVASLLAHSPIANTEDEESWQREYSDGLENELYVIRLRDAATMAGVSAAARAAVWDCPFNELALALFAFTGALAVGVCDCAGAAHINPSGSLRRYAAPLDDALDAAHVERDGEDEVLARLESVYIISRSRQAALWAIDELFRADSPVQNALKHAGRAAPVSSPRAAPVARAARARAAPPHKTYCIMCPTPRTMKMCSLLIAKLWHLAPNVTVVVLHNGGAEREAKMMLGLRAALWSEGLVRSAHVREQLTQATLDALEAHFAAVARFGEKGALFEEELLDDAPTRRWTLTRPRDRGGDGDAAAAAERFFEGAAPPGDGDGETARLRVEFHHGQATEADSMRSFLEKAEEVDHPIAAASPPTPPSGRFAPSRAHVAAAHAAHVAARIPVARARAVDAFLVLTAGVAGDDDGDEADHDSNELGADKATVLCLIALTRELARVAEHAARSGLKSDDDYVEATERALHAPVIVELAHANNMYSMQQRIWQQPRLLTSAQSTDFSEIASVYHWPAMAAGRCLPHVLTDSFIAMTFHQPQALAFWNALLGMSPSGEGEHPSASWIVREPVTTVLHDDRARLRAQSLADLSLGAASPDDGDGDDAITWKEVCESLATRGAIALGLYREANSPRRHPGMPYMVLLPNLTTRLDSKDSVFFLSSREVAEGNSSQEADADI